MSWANLDKLAMARPRADGKATVVASDDRTSSQIAETQPLSTVIAIARVIRGRRVLADRGTPGVVVYQCKQPPPGFLVDAVTAAGGIVFDGTREYASPKPLALTVQLDGAFLDLATVVRRRFKVAGFADALDVLESKLRRTPARAADPVAFWPAICELMALAGELVRANQPARWVDVADQRLPLALDLGGSARLYPAHVAQTIVEGGAGSLRSLVPVAEPERAPRMRSDPTPTPLARAGSRRGLPDPLAAGPRKRGRAMPLLCPRTAVPLERLAWKPLVDAEADHPALPVIVWVEDLGDVIHWPLDEAAPREADALANIAAVVVEVSAVELPLTTLAVITGDFFAAETVLAPATMQRVRETLATGSTATLLVGMPCRGQLVAIEAARALVDDDLMSAFLTAVEREHDAATERDRISPEVLIYAERLLGRVQSNLFEARRALRDLGVDPDA